MTRSPNPDDELFEEFRKLTPGERLALRMEAKSQKKRAKRDQRTHEAEDRIVRKSLENGPATYDTKGAAEVLRCRPEHISRLVTSGELRAVQRIAKGKGSPLLIPREALVEYLTRGLR
jgi:excisionase family DNA binding protein